MVKHKLSWKDTAVVSIDGPSVSVMVNGQEVPSVITIDFDYLRKESPVICPICSEEVYMKKNELVCPECGLNAFHPETCFEEYVNGSEMYSKDDWKGLIIEVKVQRNENKAERWDSLPIVGCFPLLESSSTEQNNKAIVGFIKSEFSDENTFKIRWNTRGSLQGNYIEFS